MVVLTESVSFVVDCCLLQSTASYFARPVYCMPHSSKQNLDMEHLEHWKHPAQVSLYFETGQAIVGG